MTNEDIKKFIHQVNEEAFPLYMESHLANWKAVKTGTENTHPGMKTILSDYILARPGWEASSERDDILIYKQKLPLLVSIFYFKDEYFLFLETIKTLIKAELISKLADDYSNGISKDQDIGELVEKIDIYFKEEDWSIPFIRQRIPNE
jgi:hypothetical protein